MSFVPWLTALRALRGFWPYPRLCDLNAGKHRPCVGHVPVVFPLDLALPQDGFPLGRKRIEDFHRRGMETVSEFGMTDEGAQIGGVVDSHLAVAYLVLR